jgi:molybdopterin-guanine dinucleotide biosynthesis protein A
VDVLILAGGEARRLGGVDKPMVEVGGWTLLDRVIEAVHDAGLCEAGFADVASASAITVVGPVRPTRRAVHWVREDPPGGGPVAAITAGLSVCRGPYVGVFAGDLPFLSAETVHSLWTTLAESEPARHDGAVAVDADGREQWLVAIYRRDALLASIADQGTDDLRGLALRRLVAKLRLLRITPAGQSVLDCDTWEDVAEARRIADREMPDHR